MQSVSAGPIRARGKTNKWAPEKPKPQRLFHNGDLVSDHNRGGLNCIVVGHEWGGNNLRQCGNRQIWFYYVKDAHGNIEGFELVPEDKLGRIS